MKSRIHTLAGGIFLFLLLLTGTTRIQAQYCTPAYASPCTGGIYLNSIYFAGVTALTDLNTGCAAGGYDNRTATSVTLNQGSSPNVTLNTGSGGTANVQAWIDFNNDFTFSATESVGGVNGITSNGSFFNLTVPAGAQTGTHRLRFHMTAAASYPAIDACGASYASGEVQDYTVVINAFTPACTAPQNLTASGMTATGVTLDWIPATGISNYEYVVDQNPTAPGGNGAAVSGNIVTVSGLTANTAYYAHVRTVCQGGFSSWVTTSFSTTGGSSSCSAPATVSVSNVTYNSATINWASVPNANNYEWAITTSITPPASGTFAVATTYNASSLTPGTGHYVHVRTACSSGFSAWVTQSFTTLPAPVVCNAPSAINAALAITSANLSWNNISGALGYEYIIDQVNANPTNAGTFTTSLNAGASSLAPNTTYYLHLRTQCSTAVFSSWILYAFTTNCPTISSVTVSNVTTSGASITWTPVAGATGYFYVLNTTATPPTTIGAPITAANFTATGLAANTTYYIHVRADCNGASTWITQSFTTAAIAGGCSAPSTLTVSNATSTGVTASWSAITGATGYQYVIDQSAGNPAGAGTTVTLPTFTATALLPNTAYYMHVRSGCGNNVFSVWTTRSFSTQAATAVETLNGQTATGLVAYPNPVRDILTVQTIGEITALQVIDLNGKVVISILPVHGREMHVDMKHLPSGLYALRCVGQRTSETIHVVKQ